MSITQEERPVWPRSLVDLRSIPLFSRAWGLVPKGSCPRKMGGSWGKPLAASAGSTHRKWWRSGRALLTAVHTAAVSSLSSCVYWEPEGCWGPEIPMGTCMLSDQTTVRCPRLSVHHWNICISKQQGPRAFYTLLGVGGAPLLTVSRPF